MPEYLWQYVERGSVMGYYTLVARTNYYSNLPAMTSLSVIDNDYEKSGGLSTRSKSNVDRCL